MCFTQVKQMIFTGFYFKNTWVKHPFIFPTATITMNVNWKFFFAKSFKRKNLSISTDVFFSMKKQFQEEIRVSLID